MTTALSRCVEMPALRRPVEPDVEAIGCGGLAEVVHASTTGRCHHQAACLTPLGVGELVIADDTGRFWSLLEHVQPGTR